VKNGKVIEHRTYIAARCVRCHDVALRLCIVHDACEPTDHWWSDCDRAYNKLRASMYASLRNVRVLARVEGGESTSYAVAYLEEAYDRIKERK
jgi:alpha-ketoglutarate-dependent taurine dioxygenase